MNLSFKEKNIWTSLIITLVVFGYYFARVFSASNQNTIDSSYFIELFISVVVVMIILEIVSHIILAVIYKKEVNESNDERDKLIELKGTRISYWILILGVFQAVAGLLMTKSPIMIANIILFFFVIAEIMGNSIKLYYYRKGI